MDINKFKDAIGKVVKIPDCNGDYFKVVVLEVMPNHNITASLGTIFCNTKGIITSLGFIYDDCLNKIELCEEDDCNVYVGCTFMSHCIKNNKIPIMWFDYEYEFYDGAGDTPAFTGRLVDLAQELAMDAVDAYKKCQPIPPAFIAENYKLYDRIKAVKFIGKHKYKLSDLKSAFLNPYTEEE